MRNLQKTDDTWYINPGSLGCPLSTDFANAGVLIINNEISYEQLEIKYDVNKVKQEIQNVKYPCYRSILKTFYGM